MGIPHWYLVSRFWRDSISRGFNFAISVGTYEKRALNLYFGLSFAAFWPRKEDDHSKYFKPSVAKRLKNMGIHSLPHIEFFGGFQYFCWHGWVQAALQNSGEIFTFGRPEQWRSSSPPLQSSISGNAFRTEVCRCLDTWNKIQHEAVF